MRATHVPVEVFGLHVEREHIRQDGVHRRGDVFGRRSREIGSCLQWGFASVKKFDVFFELGFFIMWFVLVDVLLARSNTPFLLRISVFCCACHSRMFNW